MNTFEKMGGFWNTPVGYLPKFIKDPDSLFFILKNTLNWDRLEFVPRSEYYINKLGDIPYTYGKGVGRRTYLPQPSHPHIDSVFEQLKTDVLAQFDVCFLNMYLNQRDQLGWHADNSPEMDDARPIVTISLGAEREIWFCPNEDKTKITKLKLENGSICWMAPGMQDTHLHRIPKAGFTCGERISLTFRGYVNEKTETAKTY